ncbi:MAG: glycosyltransferase family A protein [Acidobacteriaceae bacterium]
MNNDQYPLVSVLFITYKRFDLLEQSLRRFQENTDYPNLEVVIADDGSGAETQRRIRSLPADVFALSPKNRGLGANNNNGLKHCTGKYILMIQDDCVCAGPSDYLKNTIQVMEANPNVGIVNYCGAPHPLDKQKALAGSSEPCYIAPRPYEDGKKEYFLYTDQPHVVSRAALQHVGYYRELRDMVECEEDYNRRWRDQTCFATAVFPPYYKRVYVHEGAAQSFRTSLFRYRVDAFLMPLAGFFKRNCSPLYKAGRATIRAAASTLEKMRIVR